LQPQTEYGENTVLGPKRILPLAQKIREGSLPMAQVKTGGNDHWITGTCLADGRPFHSSEKSPQNVKIFDCFLKKKL